MADGTGIEWADATANCINGCSLESPGCRLCYAMKQAHRTAVRRGLTKPSKGGMVWTGEVRFHEPALQQVIRWQRPRQIFWNAHGDTFHPEVPDEWIDRCFAAMALTPQHRHLVLTKRSARMREYMESIDNGDGERLEGFRSALVEGMAQSIWHERTGDNNVDEWLAVHLPLPNVWLGVSAEDQKHWDEHTADLKATPAAVRWVSVEPMLGKIATGFGQVHHHPDNDQANPHLQALVQAARRRLDPEAIDWIVCGGESGARAKPMHPDWARSLRDQCEAAGVPFFFKQWGEHAWTEGVEGDPSTLTAYRAGKKAAGRLLDGVEHSGMPAHG